MSKDFCTIMEQKKDCAMNLNGIEKIRSLYQNLKQLSFTEMEKLFPDPEREIARNIFDYTSEIIPEPTLEKAIDISIAMFKSENINKCSDESFQNDMELLQALFFFLMEENFGGCGTDFDDMFKTALNDGSWRKPEGQAEILNCISLNMEFNNRFPFEPVDFKLLGGKHFSANESVLRLFYNFMHPTLYAREGIVNELNFVREQQKLILPVFPNVRKTNYNTSDATKEIESKNKNLKKLKELDFGFYDSDYTQSFFACDEEFKKSFNRPIVCKCFQESELEWESEPYFDKHRYKRKIIARKSERKSNRSSLTNKFLYSERNRVTHFSENFAVFKLFSKEYNRHEMKYWEELVLESIYDVYQYILGIEMEDVQKKLLSILNHYFEKITGNLKTMSNIPVENRWQCVFDSEGVCNLDDTDLRKTNLFNILSESELTHFKRFMSFMYCSENDGSDFFNRNRSRIQLYLIYISLNLSKMDF